MKMRFNGCNGIFRHKAEWTLNDWMPFNCYCVHGRSICVSDCLCMRSALHASFSACLARSLLFACLPLFDLFLFRFCLFLCLCCLSVSVYVSFTHLPPLSLLPPSRSPSPSSSCLSDSLLPPHPSLFFFSLSSPSLSFTLPFAVIEIHAIQHQRIAYTSVILPHFSMP